jgi:broad specificity phosphatase PhoE
MPQLHCPSDLFLVRHGQTEWNLVPRIQGRCDSPLTRLGIAQAKAAGRLLRSALSGRKAALFASPLGRARRTAEIIAEELGVACERITLEPRLREVSWGAWDGRSRDELESMEPGNWRRLQRDWSFAPEGVSVIRMRRFGCASGCCPSTRASLLSRSPTAWRRASCAASFSSSRGRRPSRWSGRRTPCSMFSAGEWRGSPFRRSSRDTPPASLNRRDAPD